MKLVIIESPYSISNGHTIEENIDYGHRCLQDSIKRDEAPFASHLLYPYVLDDDDPEERQLGINMGFAWGTKAHLRAVYADYGVSRGMVAGIRQAIDQQQPLTVRYLVRGAAPLSLTFDGLEVLLEPGVVWQPPDRTQQLIQNLHAAHIHVTAETIKRWTADQRTQAHQFVISGQDMPEFLTRYVQRELFETVHMSAMGALESVCGHRGVFTSFTMDPRGVTCKACLAKLG